MSGRPSDTVVQENPGKSGITPKLPDRPVARLQTGSLASVRSLPVMCVSEQIEPRQLTRVRPLPRRQERFRWPQEMLAKPEPHSIRAGSLPRVHAASAIRNPRSGSPAVRLRHRAGGAFMPVFAMDLRSVRTRDEQGAQCPASGPDGPEFRMPQVRSARVPSFRQCAFRPACAGADPECRSTGILPSSPRCSCQDA